MPKLIRITTVPISLRFLLAGQMRYMGENGFDVLMVSADGAERETVAKNEGCEHIIIPLTRKITPLKDFVCLLKMIYLFHKVKPDIVHTHTPKAGLIGMLAARICFVRTRIHTVAGLPMMVTKGNKFRLLKFIEKLTYWCANHVWPNSYSLLEYIIDQKMVNQQKLSVILNGSSNGIDLKRFNVDALNQTIVQEIKLKIQFNADNIYFVTVGRLVKDKGIEEIVNAFLTLQKKYTNIILLLVGQYEHDLDPIDKTIIQEIISNPSILHIEWTTYVEYYISLATIFVFASHREGFPNVLLQAGAFKKPIVCSAICGNVDIVENEVSGLTFECGNTEKLLKQLIKYIENPLLQKTHSDSLYEKIHTNFVQEKIWEELKIKYIKLVKQSNNGIKS